MNNIKIYVNRTTPQNENKLVEYEVPIKENETTVLEALQIIQEEIDSSLDFRYGCRFKQCGLCAMKMDDKPLMSCMAKVKNEMVIEPLDKIPVEKDVIVERKFLFEKTKDYHLFPKKEYESTEFNLNKSFDILNQCTDCQSCLSVCPNYDYENMDEFAGPLFFVKLAQLQFHPQNDLDYSELAKELGVEKCTDCNCRCPYGIPIRKLAIEPFIEKINEKKE